VEEAFVVDVFHVEADLVHVGGEHDAEGVFVGLAWFDLGGGAGLLGGALLFGGFLGGPPGGGGGDAGVADADEVAHGVDDGFVEEFFDFADDEFAYAFFAARDAGRLAEAAEEIDVQLGGGGHGGSLNGWLSSAVVAGRVREGGVGGVA